MYLKKLELHGFKSFATRTVIDFSDGITVVVGPNGCGKSNIVDAVRWVIGEQRARILRSSKMENVVFNGTKKRRRLGMAEVLLTIQNKSGILPTEYSEVTIGRRLYRSGESEYLLNGVQCRLRDITDLFMDTGMGAGAYSVIELKMIDDILSENAQDRRYLFEEAAGITKYKLRRTQTLRKLDGTQVDLNRLRDFTEELDKRVRSLKRQANKAERYKHSADRLHHLELALAQLELDRLSEQERLATERSRAMKGKLEGHRARLAKTEAQLESLRLELITRENELQARQAALTDHLEKVRSLDADRRLDDQRHETNLRDIQRAKAEQRDDAAAGTDLEKRISDLSAELNEAEPALQVAQSAFEAARLSHDSALKLMDERRKTLRDQRHTEQRIADECAYDRRQVDRLTSRCELLEQDLAQTCDQEVKFELKLNALNAEVAQSLARSEAAAEAVQNAQSALSELLSQREARSKALASTSEDLRLTERRHDVLESEVRLLESLLTSFEDFSEPVQYLAGDSGWSDSPLRTVADVFECDDKYRLALDAALGDYSACLVVDTRAEAERAMVRLSEAEKGRAAFIVMEHLKAPTTRPNTVDDGRSLLDIVQMIEPQYERLAAVLLHRCFLVDTLAELSDRAPDVPIRFVTGTGEWLDTRGLIFGGSAHGGLSPVANRMGRREQWEQARRSLELLKEEMAQKSSSVQHARYSLNAIPEAVCRDTLSLAEQALAKIHQSHARNVAEQAAVARRQAELSIRRMDLSNEIAKVRESLIDLQKKVEIGEVSVNEARQNVEAVEQAFQSAEVESRALFGQFSEAKITVLEARNRHENLLRDLDRDRNAAIELTRRSGERAERLSGLKRQRQQIEMRQDALTAEFDAVVAHRADLDAGAGSAKTALMEHKASISGVEATLREIRRLRDQDIQEENQLAVRLVETQTRADDLLSHIETDFGVSLRKNPIEVEPGLDEQSARNEVQELRGKIRLMGAVNALALEEYEEEKARLDFLTEQLQDLEQAENTLLDTINEINTTASARFSETFKDIQANFSHLFADLFGEDATADIVLSDPEDLLESSIEIMAKPRGKRPSTLTQLSGGEKTLTATALLFAIYLVKPSPFCILDEVDAPLDDANIGRFMQLIRAFSKSTQFIIVSHNKRTMEAADRMYGITMQEQGVSQVVGVKFEEALEMAEDAVAG